MAHCNQRELDRSEKAIHGHKSEQSEESQPNQINKVPRRLILAASAYLPKRQCSSVQPDGAGLVAPASRRRFYTLA
jgi:hypothetical protein